MSAHFLIVGGTRGIGRALVEHLSATGHRVSVFGRRPNPAHDSPEVVHSAVDVMDQEALLSGIDEAVSRFGKIQCAVFLQRHRGDDGGIEADVAVALGATSVAMEHMVERSYFDAGRSPSVVLVSSVADRYVGPEQPLGYHVAKAGLSQLARYYALKLGPSGVRVNAVSPCVVLKPEAAEFYGKHQALVRRYEQFIPLGRMGTPADIAGAIMFLAGESAAYITGQNIVVDGGLTLRSHESLIRDLSST